ncbi:37 kDa salivary gland allergen Aed a 2-like [Wyeomyia smithii]|uniref:37 kDa salivary gland allergen Aed a 2-like n=1 Tax=Wyeomyia smithii TaxID=174621 RepID=UPI002467E7D8|nr:37 kDa salivary gland allergen Aed a 2-like [Wyeomyia smithii]
MAFLKIVTKLLYFMSTMSMFAKSNQSSGIERCERSLSEPLKQRLCELRQYIIIEEAGEENHVYCIFSEFGYLTEQGDVKIERIIKDFSLTHYLNKQVNSSIEKCNASTQKAKDKKAFVFFECMVYSDSFEQWRDVIDFREIYGNNDPGTAYNPETVAKEVRKIDGNLCPTSRCRDEDEEDIEEQTNVSFSPDDALFIYTRCFDLHVGDGNTAREQAATVWMIFEGISNEAKCFTKCVLENLKIYSPAGGFKSNTFSAQFDDYGDYLDINEEQYNIFLSNLERKSAAEDSCEKVHISFIDIYRSYGEIIQKLLHHPNQTKSIFNRNLPHIKLPHETYPAFCERNYQDVLHGKLCEVRKFLHDDQHKDSLKELISCIFKGFRYLSASNDVKASEVRRDFALIGKLNRQSSKDIHVCTVKAQQTCADERAYYLYGCLLNSTSSTDFKEAFENKEIISGNYDRVINGVSYNREQVQAEIRQIDSKICTGATK